MARDEPKPVELDTLAHVSAKWIREKPPWRTSTAISAYGAGARSDGLVAASIDQAVLQLARSIEGRLRDRLKFRLCDLLFVRGGHLFCPRIGLAGAETLPAALNPDAPRREADDVCNGS
jgi:hypothetical protein